MERNGIEYDPETGLPKLREGLFWRIKAADTSNYLDISIVTEITYPKYSFLGVGWNRVTEYFTYEGLYVYARTEDVSTARIKTLAEVLYRDLDRMDETTARVDALVGIYPPKNLSQL